MVHSHITPELAEQVKKHLDAIRQSTDHAKRLYSAYGLRMAVMVDERQAELDPQTGELYFRDEKQD